MWSRFAAGSRVPPTNECTPARPGEVLSGYSLKSEGTDVAMSEPVLREAFDHIDGLADMPFTIREAEHIDAASTGVLEEQFSDRNALNDIGPARNRSSPIRVSAPTNPARSPMSIPRRERG